MDVALDSLLGPPKRWLISALAHVKRLVCLPPHTTTACSEPDRECEREHGHFSKEFQESLRRPHRAPPWLSILRPYIHTHTHIT